MHGRLSTLYHNGTSLFKGIPQGISIVRYHSLLVSEELPDCLEKTAWTEDGLLMGLRHKERDLWEYSSIQNLYVPNLEGSFCQISYRLRVKRPKK